MIYIFLLNIYAYDILNTDNIFYSTDINILYSRIILLHMYKFLLLPEINISNQK